MTINGTRRGTPAALAVLAVVALGLGAWIVVNSAFFAVRDVRVEGARNVSADEIRQLADIPAGANLIMLSLEDVSARLETHPWVLDADVRRDLPTTAVVRVIERTPGGWVEDPSGIAVLAGDGTVLERVSVRPSRLPALGHVLEDLAVGERADIGGEPLRVAASMGGSLRREIASVELEGSDVILRLRAGGTVLYGDPDNLSAKNRALVEMLRWANEEGIDIRTVDIRVPSAPSLEPLRVREAPSPTPSP